MAAKIAICLLTYARTEYAIKTLRSTLNNIHYSHPLSVHIADDGSPAEHMLVLCELAGGYESVQGVTHSNSYRGGYGKNINLAMQTTHLYADYVLMLEDDWELVRPLNLDELILDMEAEPRFDCVRLGYLSFTQALFGQVLDANNRKYLVLDNNSPEPHVYAGHPRLETVKRQREMGEWQEGFDPGATEFMMCHTLRARRGVAWPMDLVTPSGNLFCHIGSVRSTDV